MNGTIYALFFSPTHTTRQAVTALADSLSQTLSRPVTAVDWTLPGGRSAGLACAPGDLLLFGFPVYGGRVPLVLADPLSRLRGNGALAVPVAVYGNRDYDDALVEAQDLLSAQGFATVAAAAMIGEHSFSRRLGAGRPDRSDLEAAARFGRQIAARIASGAAPAVELPGERPYKDPMSPMPFRPVTSDACTGCMLCAGRCPMGIIHGDDPRAVDDGCIQCCACVKACPVGAKQFDAEPIRQSAARLEANFMARKESAFFL